MDPTGPLGGGPPGGALEGAPGGAPGTPGPGLTPVPLPQVMCGGGGCGP